MRKDTRKKTIFRITILAIFIAIEALVCFVPFLGSLQIGPIVATFAMVPVIIIACTLGPLEGSIMGFFAGLFSFIWWCMHPTELTAIMFIPWSPYSPDYFNIWPIIICFVPRILTGTIAAYITILMKKICKFNILNYTFASVIASLSHTFLVLFGTYFTWGKDYVELHNLVNINNSIDSFINLSSLLSMILAAVTTNGIFEAVVSGILGSTISKSLEVVKKNITR